MGSGEIDGLSQKDAGVEMINWIGKLMEKWMGK